MEPDKDKEKISLEPKNKGVQTYIDDVTKALETNKEGMIKKIIHEQEEKEARSMNLLPQSKKNRFFMIFSILMLVLAFGVIIFFTTGKKINTVEVAPPQFTPLIFSDKTDFSEIADSKKDKIEKMVFDKVNATEVKKDGVEAIYLTEGNKIIGLKPLLSKLESTFTTEQPQFLDNNFMLGVSNRTTKDFFMIMKISSFSDVFKSFRTWESKMLFDLHGFIGMDLNASTNYLLEKDFEDGVIWNKNARILRDKDDKIVLMYVFADDNSVVITNTEDTAGEIMLRLTSGKIKK